MKWSVAYHQKSQSVNLELELQKEKKSSKGAEILFKEVMAENFSNLGKDWDI